MCVHLCIYSYIPTIIYMPIYYVYIYIHKHIMALFKQNAKGGSETLMTVQCTMPPADSRTEVHSGAALESRRRSTWNRGSLL